MVKREREDGLVPEPTPQRQRVPKPVAPVHAPAPSASTLLRGPRSDDERGDVPNKRSRRARFALVPDSEEEEEEGEEEDVKPASWVGQASVAASPGLAKAAPAPTPSNKAFTNPSSSSAPAAAAAASSSSSYTNRRRDERHIKSAEAQFWRNDACLRALARAIMPDVSMVLSLANVSFTVYKASMAVFLERIEISRGSIGGIHKLLSKKRYLAQFVKVLVVSDNWPFGEVWLPSTTTVALSFAQFWPSLTPFGQMADIFSWVCPKKDANAELVIDIALDFWCYKAMYEVCRAQQAAAARVRAIRVTGAAVGYAPPTSVKPEDRATFLAHFQDVMWASVESIMRFSDRLDLFQVIPRGDSKDVITLPPRVIMTLADHQYDVKTIKLSICPENKYALSAFTRHFWNGLTSLSLQFSGAASYAYEMKELDILLGKKWLDLEELRMEFSDEYLSDALKWGWSHPRLRILDVDMSKAVEDRVIKFVHDHPSIEHLSLHSDEKCKRPSKYPPKLRSCTIKLPASKKDPFEAVTESRAPYATALLKGRKWNTELSRSVPWTEHLSNLTGFDLVLEPVQVTSVCEFFGPANTAFFPNLLEICLICDAKFELPLSKRFRSGFNFFTYALEHLRFFPRLQVIALNSCGDDALDLDEVRSKLLQVGDTLRAAAWLTSAEEAQIFKVEQLPHMMSGGRKAAALSPVSPFLAGFSRLDCGQEERGWPYDYGFFLHSPDGRAVPRSPLVSFPG
ncbi:unnamed protein product [Tilletia controversa]|nr:unnamed protein product [Tilletia controversa]CAD6905469.1 unnamed protein product [Tilletia controversa]CAD6921114.1 unnamed protein product [Tilletia controversa]CAD6983449.1 unnamed protein product [Tilletia controversa]CAD6985408.1 unnamed protein product [Tilletia controversa]